jgi:tight adherence protein B
MNPIVLAVFAGVLAVTLFVAALTAGDAPRRRLRQRAKALKNKRETVTAATSPAASLLRSKKRTVPLVETLAERFLPDKSRLHDRLARAGCDVSIGSYVLACLAVGVLFGGMLALSTAVPVAAASLAGITAGVLLPHLVLVMLAKRRQAAFMALFPDAVALMVRGVKSGLPITETMRVVGEELPPPVGSEFRRISDLIRLGSLPEDVLLETAKRLDLPDFKFFVICLSIQKETGGNLAESLTNLGSVLRSRRQMKLKIKAMSSEAKASAYILGGLPVVMFFLISLINPDYASVLIDDPRGRILLGFGIASMLTAAVVMAKMIRFEI